MIFFTSNCGPFPPHQKVLHSTTRREGVECSFAVRRIIVICSLVRILGLGALGQATSDHAADSAEIVIPFPLKVLGFRWRSTVGRSWSSMHKLQVSLRKSGRQRYSSASLIWPREGTLRPRRFGQKSVALGP